jgi:Domain of Unknown Function (DUF1080)
MAGRGTFHAIDGALQSVPSFDLGLFWCTIPMSQNFRLELEFFTRLFQTNSEVFIRFKNPESTGYYNPTLSAVFIPGMSAAPAGFQIQIEIPGRRMGPRNVGPEQFMPSITQATHSRSCNTAGDPGDFANPQNAQLLAWNQYRIEVQGDVITVNLNGVDTCRYTNPDPNRGRFSAAEPTFIGLQAYSNYAYTTAFRNVRITVL